jgi:hypothetical protein
MFFAVMGDLIPFILIFTGFITVFSLIQFILSSQTEDSDDTYPGVNLFARMMI